MVSFGLFEPVTEVGEDLCNVMSIESEVEVTDLAALVEEGLIDKVPSLLIRSSLILDLICEGGTLDEWVIFLALGPLRIGLLERLEDVQGLLKCVWILLLKDQLSDSGGEEMASVPPGTCHVDKKGYKNNLFHIFVKLIEKCT